MIDPVFDPEITLHDSSTSNGTRSRRAAIRLRPRSAGARFTPEAAARLAMILAEGVDFVESPMFGRGGAEERIFDNAPAVRTADVGWYRPLMDDMNNKDRDSIRSTKRVVFTAAEERTIFYQLNYARYCMARIIKRTGKRGPDTATARTLLGWDRRVESLRDRIAEANLALVLAMAKRVRAGDGDFGDFISEGNMALMRSIDKFDVGRGFKFSTYACRAILKAFSRHGMKLTKYRQRFPVGFDPEMEQGNHASDVRVLQDGESAAEVKHLVQSNAADLSIVERRVLSFRFALGLPVGTAQMTLEQVGSQIGVTKERVRQIQNAAIAKLRVVLENSGPRSSLASTCGQLN
ncbi:MAG: sigma-70 family RNA polymerase sigma factor [Phycisphaerales bacterium]|nr:sigma-70 family RNA polymerase sigma factor [Phycisphaerales bacterium]